jgi:hypothetical protein
LSVSKNPMRRPAIQIVSLFLVGMAACSGGGKSGAGGNGGSAAGAGGGGIGGHGGSAGTGGAAGASGNDGDVDAAACSCFLHGTWKVDNLSPCFYTVVGEAGTSEGAISTIENAGQSNCPTEFSMAPTAAWSTDTLTTDCAGHYRLCYTLKVGTASSPQPNDCVVAQSCAEGDYTTVNQPQTWPDLPGWISTGAELACAMTFDDGGGYGEMTVTGMPTGCAAITKTIGTVTYCPPSCNQPNPPAACANCVNGASDGGF